MFRKPAIWLVQIDTMERMHLPGLPSRGLIQRSTHRPAHLSDCKSVVMFPRRSGSPAFTFAPVANHEGRAEVMFEAIELATVDALPLRLLVALSAQDAAVEAFALCQSHVSAADRIGWKWHTKGTQFNPTCRRCRRRGTSRSPSSVRCRARSIP